MTRQEALAQLGNPAPFDVIIIGAGINGATLFDKLCRQGYRVLLIDKADFAGGTSQASGMMIWGGLLYLTNFELGYVAKLSVDRDNIINEKKQWVAPRMMRYIPAKKAGRSKWWVYAGLWFYWLLSIGRRKIPRIQNQFSERQLLKEVAADASLCYEEAVLQNSDARFVYRHIAPHRNPDQFALNYCSITGSLDSKTNEWALELQDQLTQKNYAISAKVIVNCAGVWTDEVNTQFYIQTSFKHVFSKGVYLGFARPKEHELSVFFDLGEHDDVITYVPWGAVSLWGPTETMVQDLTGAYQVSSSDVDYLLAHYNQRFTKQLTRADIVSMRCGVRPLVVPVDQAPHNGYPLDLSRGQEVIVDPAKPWISCYGGKITGAARMADLTANHIGRLVKPMGVIAKPQDEWESQVPWITLPHFSFQVPNPRWCAEREYCLTLADYLRRRTNIAQWIPRGGLGQSDENAPSIMHIAIELSQGDEGRAKLQFDDYSQSVVRDFDRVVTFL